MGKEDLGWADRLLAAALGTFTDLANSPTSPEALGTLLGALVVLALGYSGAVAIRRGVRYVRPDRSDRLLVTAGLSALAADLLDKLRDSDRWAFSEKQLSYGDGKTLRVTLPEQLEIATQDGWRSFRSLLSEHELRYVTDAASRLVVTKIQERVLWGDVAAEGRASDISLPTREATAGATTGESALPVSCWLPKASGPSELRKDVDPAAPPPKAPPAPSAAPEGSVSIERAHDDYTLRLRDLRRLLAAMDEDNKSPKGQLPVFCQLPEGRLAHLRSVSYHKKSDGLVEEDGDQVVGPCVVLR